MYHSFDEESERIVKIILDVELEDLNFPPPSTFSYKEIVKNDSDSRYANKTDENGYIYVYLGRGPFNPPEHRYCKELDIISGVNFLELTNEYLLSLALEFVELKAYKLNHVDLLS